MITIAEECLKILKAGTVNVTVGGRRGPYRVDELEGLYKPNAAACGISQRNRGKKEDDDAN